MIQLTARVSIMTCFAFWQRLPPLTKRESGSSKSSSLPVPDLGYFPISFTPVLARILLGSVYRKSPILDIWSYSSPSPLLSYHPVLPPARILRSSSGKNSHSLTVLFQWFSIHWPPPCSLVINLHLSFYL